MNQFGTIPGMAIDLKTNFGPFLLVAEYDFALKSAKFVDDAARQINIAPATWQVVSPTSSTGIPGWK